MFHCRSPGISIDGNDGLASGVNSQDDPWSKSFEEIMSGDVTISSDDIPRHMSRDPDGASTSDTRPSSPNDNPVAHNGGETEGKILIDSYDEDEDDEKTKRKTKRINLLSCLGSNARISFRKKGNKKKS